MAMIEAHKFPNDPILAKLLVAAQRTPESETIISDVLGFEKSYQQLLGDILQTRSLMTQNLPRSALNNRNILNDDSPYVAILARSGYEFLVAFFAIRALGGAAVPLASGVHPEEAQYFLSKTKATCILVAKDLMETALNIRIHVQKHSNSKPLTLSSISHDAEAQGNPDVQIDDTLEMDPAGPGIVLFTSGTTGQPKGAVLPKRCFTLDDFAEPNSSTLNFRSAHWMGGTESLIKPIVTGKKLYCLGEKADAEDLLRAFINYRVTSGMFTPTLLRKMKELMTGESGELSQEIMEKYSVNFKNLSTIRCYAAPIEPSVREFWESLTGLPLENCYGSTELGGTACRGVSEIHGSIGKALADIEIRLSERDSGEILVKSPNMLTHYLNDEEKTREAFDQEGYFKTGDTGLLTNGEYIFTGRANADYVLFRYLRIPTLAVEKSLLDLPYISEACVLGVPFYEAKQLCGAAIRLKDNAADAEQINLAKIRSDLQKSLPTSMQPVVLRILKDGEDLPLTLSGKPMKKQIAKDYFGTTESFPETAIPPGVEYCGSRLEMVAGESKPWDWGGLQPA